ncbi:hypothetical protein N7G274_003894 [Stereocaulon virgatum]|uniref:Uncharacterized protein n=1 Tax=Stereocaulon virgatum TaxID=373712 RepID=A0ABR4ACM5_9LECA
MVFNGPVDATSRWEVSERPAFVDDYCPFLDLPREIRDQIFGEVFFPGEKQPENQDRLGLARTAVRQIFPYTDARDSGPTKFDLSIIRTCKQIQHEAEGVLYGTSSWNLMYRDWEGNLPRLSFECFERLPRRLRKYIQRIERKCYSVHYKQTISLLDWTVFMTFLARECPRLHSLKLWGPGDRNEAPGWLESCKKDAEWIQAILQIRSLTCFDIPVIDGGIIYEDTAFKDNFLPWLKSSLVDKPQ